MPVLTYAEPDAGAGVDHDSGRKKHIAQVENEMMAEKVQVDHACKCKV